jgi:hypothetical protein
MYKLLEEANLATAGQRAALLNFRAYVDEYIYAMTKFMNGLTETDQAVIRSLLAAESDRLLKGAAVAAQKAVDEGKVVVAAAAGT